MAKRVRMTRHAATRVVLRATASPARVRGIVERRLAGMLRAGVEPDPGLGVRVPVEDGVVAICVPSLFGGWDMVTVKPEDEKTG